MKIEIADPKGKCNKQIIIGYKTSAFSTHIQEKTNYSLIQDRIKNKKDLTVIHDGSSILFIVVLKDDPKQAYLQLEDARKAAHSLYPFLKDNDAESLTLVNAGVSEKEVLSFCEGLYLTNYQFNKYFTKKKEEYFSIANLQVLSKNISQSELVELTSILEGTAFSRDLVNEPLSYLTAIKLAEEIDEKSKEAGYTVEVFNKKKIESLRMGGLLAVNKGSIDPPTFSILEWKPENAVNEKPYVLVGKGIVFDTGGLSLKPTQDSMDYMKCDMGGAAAVAGAIYAISKAKLPVHVIGLLPATDNRPDGNAYVPGDVVTMHDGSTVEVLNTDAEGRMILADALSYAKQYKPQLTIELSTLTGSAHAAVGKYAIVGMGNAHKEDMEQLINSGFNTFERIAEFPFWDD
ncbi:MAG: leucyl aminopeptidase family protein, partial [Bacteroidales bacterium]|nr:leucyl aminopeptidase family protein [Bacteroidales bacterium]